MGVNTVNHVFGKVGGAAEGGGQKNVTWLSEGAEEWGFWAFPCHVTPRLFITDVTPPRPQPPTLHDGYILLSLIVMKCKLRPEVGD